MISHLPAAALGPRSQSMGAILQ